MKWKNDTVTIEKGQMDYLAFGRGEKVLILIPGLGDGFKTVKGMAFPFSVLYRKIGSEYRVYSFSRRRNIAEGHTVKDMAEDLYLAAKALGIERAHIVGVSLGGMIAQQLAAEHTDFAEKLVLTVTTDKMEEEYCTVIKRWMEMAERGDYAGIMTDTAERSYSEAYLKTARLMYGVITRVGKPKSFERFLIQAQACLDHDASGLLDKISCPTLILGGMKDKIAGPQASFRLSEGIKDAKLYMYETYGHGAYEEAKDFQDRLLEFLNQEEVL